MKFADSPLLSQTVPAWRARFMLGALMLGFAALITRAVYLQGVNNEYYQEKGASRYARTLPLAATRGRISDRYGDMLAVSTPVRSIWAIPDDTKLQPAQVRELARLLDLEVRDLDRKLATDGDFVFIKRQISPELAGRVMALNLPGIHDQPEFRRYYPSGEVAAHLIGFTGAEDHGQEGMELAFDARLTGEAGSRRVIKDRRGAIIEDVEGARQPREGQDIRLSVDAKLQYQAYAALQDAISANHAKAGTVAVLDAKSGEILALVNAPTYNPNNREKLSGAQLRNRAFTDSFEPGSTLKPFTIALALEQGKVRFDTPIQTAPGHLTIGNATISDAHPHGVLSVAEVIQKSSNVGAAKIAGQLTPHDMWNNFDALGFGAPLKLGFPGEVGGRLRPWKFWKPIEQATMSYGHGISVSLMQLAHAYLVFARDGDLVPPTLVRQDGEPVAGTRVYSPQTAREVRAMLEMAVGPGGTAPKAQVPGYRVAGKTGTAHKLEGGVYAHKYVSSFVGFAPVSDPRLLVAVMIDEPSGGMHYGGDVAAPVFSRIMGAALRSLGVPPDAPEPPVLKMAAGTAPAKPAKPAAPPARAALAPKAMPVAALRVPRRPAREPM